MAKYIIGHWTAGNYTPCVVDLTSYQELIDGKGKVYPGKPVGKTASTAGMNSITFNIACCGGLDRTPVTPIQFEAFCKRCAQKLKELNLSVNSFYTHAEIGEMCKNGSITSLLLHNKWLKDNIGKIDLTKIPALKGTAKQTGDFIRGKIKWYLSKV